ncbi:hypothetical protein ISN44_As07g009340, partial [Arabidopsis suecica]
MGIRESTALGWPLFTSVGDFHGRQLRWRFHLVLVVLNFIGNNIDLLWTKMVSCGGVGDRLLGLMEFLITNRSVGLSTAMGYAAMDVACLLMHESQQVFLFRRVSHGYLVLVIVMGLSGSEGHENLEMMMSLLTNSWLGLFQLLVSTTVADVITFFVVRIFSPPSRGVLVRVMIMWFIHGVFPGMLGVFGLETIIVDIDLVKICNPRCIWDPGITSKAFVVKIPNDVYGVECTIGWAYTGIKPNFLLCAMAPIWTNWYRNVEIIKLITGATGLFYVMWSFKQRMPKKHLYHTRVRWLLKKEHIMYCNMIASKAYGKEASLNSLLRLCHLQHMAHKFAYVINCFCKVLYWPCMV